MKSLLEPLRFREPLREVHLTSDREAAAEVRTRQRETEAYERGRREGEQALSEQLVRQRAELLELQNGVLDSLQQVLPQLTRQCEQELVDLALEAARKLVAGLPIVPEMVEAAVREALAQVEDSTGFTVQLHPEDLELLQQVNAPLLLPQGGVERVQFQKVDHVTRGGCIVQTRFGSIDARRETKLELLRRAVLNA